MVKKCLLVLALAVGIAAGVSAQSLWNVGGGLIFETGSLGSWEGYIQTTGHVGSRAWTSASLHQTGFGAWAFVDATFVEFSIAFMGGPQTFDLSSLDESSGSATTTNITLLGRLPIFLGWGDIFPLLGVGACLTFHHDEAFGGQGPLAFRIVFGVGGDVDLTRNVFLRASILGSHRFANWCYSQPWEPWDHIRSDIGGWGVTIKAGIGFRL